MYLRRLLHANSEHSLIQTPGPVPFGPCICSSYQKQPFSHACRDSLDFCTSKIPRHCLEFDWKYTTCINIDVQNILPKISDQNYMHRNTTLHIAVQVYYTFVSIVYKFRKQCLKKTSTPQMSKWHRCPKVLKIYASWNHARYILVLVSPCAFC